MKKVKGFLLGIGLVVILCGCGAEVTNEEVNKEPEMTVVNDELVSTSDRVVEVKTNVEQENALVASTAEEISEDRESIHIDKSSDKEMVVEETEQASVVVENNPVYTDGAVTQEDFVIQVGDILVHTGDTMNAVVEDLGTPDDYVQARSCLYDGDDKVYTYGGIVIYTYPSGADDIVYLIEMTGDEKLLSGIGVGSSQAEIIEVYGKDYTEFGTMLAYDLSETASLSFQIENDLVSFIEIYNE